MRGGVEWVLTLPLRLRYLLAWDHALCRAVVAVYLRAVLGWLRREVHRRGVVDGRGGAVAIVQRFGAALNLNVHIHALVLDGVFAPDGRGGVSFRAHERQDDDVGPLLVTIQRRIEALLTRRGVPDREGFDAPDRWAEDAPTLAGLAAASVRGVAALGARAGAPVRRWGDTIEAPDPPPLGRWHARQQGFDLHAGIVVPAGCRDRLERLCRYALRPPVGQDRLQLTPDGKAVLELRRRWTDGTTHLVFDPVELLERLAALTPRPRINMILYHAPRLRSGRPELAEGRRARPTSGVATGRGAKAPGHWRCAGGAAGRRQVCREHRRYAATASAQSHVGGADAARLWIRRAGVSALSRSVEAGGVDSGRRGDPAHPASPGAADGGARAAAVARPAPAVRGRR